MSRADGGAAFPMVIEVGRDAFSQKVTKQVIGLTKRDHFATHAPAVPDWFKHTATRPKPSLPDVPAHFTASQRDDLAEMAVNLVNITGTYDSEVSAYWNKLYAAKDEIDAWRDEQRQLKFFAWRFYYADMMLAERSK